jgi:hypothetical protein
MNTFRSVCHTICGGINMSELNNLLNDIEKLRENLYNLINDKNFDLADLEIISASQMLNAAITKYNEIIIKKVGK